MLVSAPEQIVQTLEKQRPAALFYSELAAKLNRSGLTARDLELALAELEAGHKVVSTRYPAPDVHLESMDLRVIALVRDEDSSGTSPAEASEAVWSDWLRQFLANHRCQ